MLGTAINGAVSSPVSGGVPLYRDTFLDPDFVKSHPEFAEELAHLQVVLDEYIGCVVQALRVHGRLCKDIAYHEALKSRASSPLPIKPCIDC
jgi:dedicator of cytokinesis protein 3